MNTMKWLTSALLFLMAVQTPAYGRRAVLMTYYGTNNDAARRLTTDALTRMMADSLEGVTVAEAYTSSMVVDALRKKGVRKPLVGEALDSLRALGCDTVVVANCQLLDGVMTRDVERSIAAHAEGLTVSLTRPLLYNSEDCRWLAGVVTTRLAGEASGQVVLVGHGSDDSANAMYALFDYVLQHSGHTRFHVGTLENYPDLGAVEDILGRTGDTRVTLYPLLLIAGNHALHDIKGEWRRRLEDKGYQVDVVGEGLLELPDVKGRILDQVRRTMMNM